MRMRTHVVLVLAKGGETELLAVGYASKTLEDQSRVISQRPSFTA